MRGKDLNAANHVGQEPQVEVREIEIGSVTQTLSVALISVDIHRFSLAEAAQSVGHGSGVTPLATPDKIVEYAAKAISVQAP